MDGEFSSISTSSPAPSQSAPVSAPSTASAPSNSSSTNTSNGATPSSSSATQSSVSSTSENKVISQTPSGRQQLVVDAFGRRVVKVSNNTAAEQKPQSQPQQATEGFAGEPQPFKGQPFSENIDNYVNYNNAQPNQYNIEEFSQALASGNVDERRVPEQYRSQYENFRINQAVQQYNANQKKLEEERKAQVEEQLTPEQKSKNMTDFYSSLDKESTQRAYADAMLSEEDIENLPYMDEDDPKLINFKMAKDFHKQQIMNDLQSRAAEDRAKREAQAQVYAGIQNFVAEARAKEPNFDAIDVMMKERFKTLPYAEGQKIATIIDALGNGTITEAQAGELKTYYENCRRELYAKRNGLSTQPQQFNRPPVLERPGGNAAPPAQYTPDYAALRNASGPKERRAWVMQFMRAQANRNS